MWSSRSLLIASIIAASVVVLPEPVGPGDQDEAARLAGEVGEHRRQLQVVEALDLLRDVAEGGAHSTALEVAVDAEAGDSGDRVGEVELLLVLEALALVVVEDRVDDLAGLLRASAPGSRPSA